MFERPISWVAILLALLATMAGGPLVLDAMTPTVQPFVFYHYPGQYAGGAWLVVQGATVLLLFMVLRGVIAGAIMFLVSRFI